MRSAVRWSFRAKLLAIVGATALAFVLLTLTNTLIEQRVARQLEVVQEHYVPKLTLGPALDGQFERLRRGFQDAVAAQDTELLAATRALKDGLIERLDRAQNAVPKGDAVRLRAAVEDYYGAAHDVSDRLIAGETGEGLVKAMAEMQSKQARAVDAIHRVAVFDPREIARSFVAVRSAEAAATRIRLLVSVACLALVLALTLGFSRTVLRSLNELTVGLGRFGNGDFSRSIHITSRDEIGELARHANQMAQNLKRLSDERARADWLKDGHTSLVHELDGELQPSEAAGRALRFLCGYLRAPAAALYYLGDDGSFELLGQHAAVSLAAAHGAAAHFRMGEGLVGQAAGQEDIVVITDLPEGYFRIRSGLGETAPRTLVLLPIMHVGRVTGVLELACLEPWSSLHGELLLAIRETLATKIEVARSGAALRDLLAETQRQAAHLASQDEELRATNEQLEAQQEELRHTNEELSRQTAELEEQRHTLERNNAELSEARQRLEQQAVELSRVSAYKTQFLANMSHELRTPLNSLLLLSNLLAENTSGNLTEKQVEFCRTIHGSGKDLLELINQVLDLAKVESGKQELQVEPVSPQHFAEHARKMFEPLARDKGLDFVVEVEPGLPATIFTDAQRAEQILNNLLGNAVKFTERGRIELRVGTPEPDARFSREGLNGSNTMSLVVSDSGVGISAEHQERIFVPFEQVDASPNRRYGGTGLGLTIARELASLLGGELQVRSTAGVGSTFTCYLPYEPPVPVADQAGGAAGAHALAAPASVRSVAASSERRLLVIEDDVVFADVLRGIIEEQGLGCLLAHGGAVGLHLARERRPDGIILDVRLADIDGWRVMEALRSDPDTASIPVHFVSAVDASERGMSMGAIGYLTKPATREQLVRVVESLARRAGEQTCRILIVEDDLDDAESVLAQLDDHDMRASRVSTAREALETLERECFSCIVLDLGLPDMDGLELLQILQERRGAAMPPVVVYTGRALSKAETQRLEAYTEAVVLKDGPESARLVDELRLFARRLKDGVHVKGSVAVQIPIAGVKLAGRTILVVDDDMRTVYALSALLRAKGAEVLVADTGRVALDALAKQSDVDAVLMDIMMPEMDGYEAMRRIRQNARLEKLPVIALTAKAMKGDRDKCLEAGATDYMPKPIDGDRLLAMLSSVLTGGSTR